jgi:hypothetical protein
VNANTTFSFQFYGSGTTNYVQINNTSATAATVTTVSVQSAGIAPTDWNSYATGGVGIGIVRKVVGTGTENGISYADFQFSGTTTAAGGIQIYPETTTYIAAGQGQTWTTQFFVKLQGGSTSGLTSEALYINEWSSGGTYLVGNSSAITLSSSGLTTDRYTMSRTLTNSGTAYTQPYFTAYYNSGATINITIRVGMPQMKQSGYATSVIPTFGSAVTRTADVYSIPDGGTYFNSSGVLTQAPVNTPRLDHSPASPYYPMGILRSL